VGFPSLKTDILFAPKLLYCFSLAHLEAYTFMFQILSVKDL
jgi:hypothetical protein